MSDIQKPVVAEEQQPVVTENAPAPAAPVVAAEPAPAPAVVESAPAPATTEIAAAPAVEETKPVVEEVAMPEVAKEEFHGEGVLGYKAPGGFLKKLAGFKKHHFWLGNAAVESKDLNNYLRGEKQEVGNHNVAWAAQTGKGLLFFSKLASEKTPAGIINLADVTDVKEEGTAEFLFHIHGQKHVFQATSISLRDSWVEAIKTASTEAKESVETIKSSENYKTAHATLTKPVEAPVAPKKEEQNEIVETPPPAVTETTPATTEAAAAPVVADVSDPKVETKEEKKARTKSRSASRKRQSIFGSFNLGGKKSEEVTPKAENKDEVKAEPSAEPVAASSEPAQVEPAVAVAPATQEPAATTSSTEEPKEIRPAAAKRHSSLFDFKSRFGGQKKATSPPPAVPAKEEETVTSAEAPVIPAVEQSEPLATSIASPATVPTETTTVGEPATAAASETKVEATPEAKADKRKSSLPFGFGSKKEKNVDGAEKPLSPFAKLRQTVKGKKSEEAAAPKAEEVASEKKEEVKPVDTATPVVADIEQPKTEKVDEDVVAPAPSANPTVAATA